MNKWECDFPGCKNTAVGCGGALGLRAVGWYFNPPRREPLAEPLQLGDVVSRVLATVGDRTPRIFCPRHRPDAIPCRDEYSAQKWEQDQMREIDPDWSPGHCGECKGEQEAAGWQLRIAENLGVPDIEYYREKVREAGALPGD